MRRIWFRNQLTPDDDLETLSLKSHSGDPVEIMSPLVGVVDFQSELSASDDESYLGSNLNVLLSYDREQLSDDYLNNYSNSLFSNGNHTNGSSVCYADYPDIAAIVAQKVSSGEADKGILVCGTGIGMCIVANKFPNIRAAFCHSELTAELSRKHNDANVLCLSGEMIGASAAVAIVSRWLKTEYMGGRHQARIDKIHQIEEETGL